MSAPPLPILGSQVEVHINLGRRSKRARPRLYSGGPDGAFIAEFFDRAPPIFPSTETESLADQAIPHSGMQLGIRWIFAELLYTSNVIPAMIWFPISETGEPPKFILRLMAIRYDF